MRRFLLRLAAFFALQACLAAPLAVRLLRQPAPDGFLAENARKQERLRSLPGRRLVFVGGSATAFGIDSPRLEEALGLPVVNMGLYLPLGLTFMLDELRDGLRAGDVVVVSPEYSLLFREGLPSALERLLIANPAAIRHVDFQTAKRHLDGLHKVLGASAKRALRELFTGPDAGAAGVPPYSLDSFNAQGDVVAHHALPRSLLPPGPYGLGGPEDPLFRRHLDLLGRFQRDCAARGATALYSYPPAVRDCIDLERERFDAVVRALDSALPLPRLHGADEMLFPLELFFDTPEHLTLEGKRRRTEILVRALAPRLRP